MIARLVLPVSMTSASASIAAGSRGRIVEDGVHRRRQHDDERVADLGQRLAGVDGANLQRSGQRRCAASAIDVPISPGPTIASPREVSGNQRAHPRRATGSRQMLRPIAGAMIRSSAINRSNCAGNIDCAPSLSA